MSHKDSADKSDIYRESYFHLSEAVLKAADKIYEFAELHAADDNDEIYQHLSDIWNAVTYTSKNISDRINE